jgi:hypothetical protein
MAGTADDWVYFVSDTGREWVCDTRQGYTSLVHPQEFAEPFIRAVDYPALAEMWDNEADTVYDNI